MSRIGKMPVHIPAGVTAKVEGNALTVKGPKGELSGTFNSKLTIKQEGDELIVSRPDDERQTKALHGLTRALIANMVKGVHEGFQKTLDIVGIGYRAAVKGKDLELTVGYSHPVIMTPPAGIEVQVPQPTQIVISGADKQAVGQFASEVREVRPPEPYKGKGIRYHDEFVRHKEGKAGKGAK